VDEEINPIKKRKRKKKKKVSRGRSGSLLVVSGCSFFNNLKKSKKTETIDISKTIID